MANLMGGGSERGEMESTAEERRVCVTGAGGFVASWLVKLLLSKDYLVHGTVREPSDEKNAHLKKLEKSSENLRLFKADLLDYDALCAAIAGCEGVFHTACPVPAGKVPNPEIDLVAPAVTGTLNVLKACSEAKVRRVVVVSSVAAVAMNPNWPQGKVQDEDCWSDREFCKTIENWYCLSKTIAEGEALDYAKKSGLDVVAVCPSMVIGPLLQRTINASSLFLIRILKGDRESMPNSTLDFVDVRDVAEALLLAYEKPEASGRYICASHPIVVRDFIDKLKRMYPNFNYPMCFTEGEWNTKFSSEKLEKLGWKHRTLEESLADSVEYFLEAGLLNRD